MPLWTALTSSGVLGDRPGVRKITSSWRSWRYSSPRIILAPRLSSSWTCSAARSRGTRSRTVTSAPARSSILIRGVLLTPMPITATGRPCISSRYSLMVDIARPPSIVFRAPPGPVRF